MLLAMASTRNSNSAALTQIKTNDLKPTPSLCKLISTLFWSEWELVAAERLEQRNQSVIFKSKNLILGEWWAGM